jgi:hypothetical protein
VRVALVAATLTAALVLPRGQAVFAFKTDQDGHAGITTEVLPGITRTVGTSTMSFSKKAIDQIVSADNGTDWREPLTTAAHFDNEDFAGASARLVRLKGEVVALITADSPDGTGARKSLGRALHTVQDFYAHSNWVELGKSGFNPDLGRSIFPGPGRSVKTCVDGFSGRLRPGLTFLTSGWFSLLRCEPAPGKVIHGDTAMGCDEATYGPGLAKDRPGRAGFDAARSCAVQATRDYVNQVLDDPRVAGNAKAIAALMNCEGNVGRRRR